MRRIIMQKDNIALAITTNKDIDYLAKLLGDIKLMQFTFGKTFSKQEAKEYIQNHFNFDGILGFSPLLLENKPIGFGGIFKWDESSYELGYILDTSYWGKGLATKAALMQRDYILNTLNSKPIATTHPQNLASQRVLKKCGFEYLKDISMEYRGDRKLFEYSN